MLIWSFNGKPQALPIDFACAFGSPLNENDQDTNKSTPRELPVYLWKTLQIQPGASALRLIKRLNQ
jgi:hypothetical protein